MTFEEAIATGRAFLAECDAGTVIVPDGDADGLCSGALVARALGGTPRFELARKGEGTWSETMRERLAGASRLVVLDAGVPAEPLLEVPTLVVDHHRPRGTPRGVVVVSSHTGSREPTSLVTWELVRDRVGEEHEWLAVLGGVADMGAPARRAAIEERWGKTNLVRAISLVNAARRAPPHDVRTALDVLLAAREPADIAKGRVPGVEKLAVYRSRVKAEMDRWGVQHPRFAGKIALLPIRSPARIHGLLAMRWSRRIPKYHALCANWGWIEGRVSFSMRTSTDVDLNDLLHDFGAKAGLASLGYGHAQATGGSLAAEEFDRLLVAMGFAPEAHRP